MGSGAAHAGFHAGVADSLLAGAAIGLAVPGADVAYGEELVGFLNPPGQLAAAEQGQISGVILCGSIAGDSSAISYYLFNLFCVMLLK